jgi:DNA-binding FadR family transcriptional regulator
MREHQSIVDAIAAGDGESADLAMRYHLESSRNRLRTAYD